MRFSITYKTLNKPQELHINLSNWKLNSSEIYMPLSLQFQLLNLLSIDIIHQSYSLRPDSLKHRQLRIQSLHELPYSELHWPPLPKVMVLLRIWGWGITWRSELVLKDHRMMLRSVRGSSNVNFASAICGQKSLRCSRLNCTGMVSAIWLHRSKLRKHAIMSPFRDIKTNFE